MKKIILILFAVLLSFAGKAQEASAEIDLQRPYLSLGTGVNAATGMLGVGFEMPVINNFGAKINAGLGMWGYKMAVQAKYYKLFPSSWAFGIGYSTASGFDDFDYKVELSSEVIEEVNFNLTRAHMLDLVVSKSWGKRVRFTLDLGYAIKIAGGKFESTDSSVELSSTAETMLNLLSPGGIIFGVGVAFGL